VSEALARPAVHARTVVDVVETFRRWLLLPDPGPLYAVLGAVAANRLEGDPVWLLLIGPPGGGKSELLGSLAALEDVHPTATLTEAALLSGTPRKDHDPSAKGGLLRIIGEFGLILCKDFGSVLNMNRDARAAVLAALREVYDGNWTRHLGTDGGKTLHWSGKVGLLAGCTPTIDRHNAVMGAMGERFVLFRLPEMDNAAQARQALSHAGQERAMRRELATAVADLFSQPLEAPRGLDEDERERLVSLTTLVVRCRSAVERDGYSREVELIPGAEAPTRLVVVLERFLAGLDVVGVERADAWRVVTKAALDSIPALRRSVMDTLYVVEEPLPTSDVATRVGYPRNTAHRALEDLAAHGIVAIEKQGQGKADLWSLTPFSRAHYSAALTFPEKSEPLSTNPNRGNDDKSGEPGERPSLRAVEELAWR
jgi:DNA-binding transcriptional ArsR family regulator